MEPPPAWASPSKATPAAAAASLDANQHEQELFAKYSTLNEPVLTTILRDVHAVAAKLRIVLRPLDYSSRSLIMSSYSAVSTSGAATATTDNGATANNSTTVTDDNILSEHDKNVLRQLKDWDLWGPLVVCLGLAVVLSFKAPTNQARLTFAAVFCAFWVGGSVVTINAQLLGGTISFFQSLCVLGYSVFPLLLSATVIGTLKIVFNTWLWLDMVITAAGCLWAMRISSVFVSLYIKPERRALALYPVVFFYTFLAWLILLF
jgi:protein YIPF6